ncbi:MAG: zinc ribbon domain-containing protein [Candidatus Kariarchaeaceae archaeon]|jgi:hypothetical protein
MKDKGLIFKKIDPRYTSQKCCHCGFISRRNRNNSQFKCRRCGYCTNSDRNAAINIEQDYFDYSAKLFVKMETLILIPIPIRRNLAKGGIATFSGAQISSPIVASKVLQ